MQNRYPAWKYALLVIISIIGLIYALPNIYGEDPALQISPSNSEMAFSASDIESQVKTVLEKAHIPFKSMETEQRNVLVRFKDTDAQLKSRDLIKSSLGDNFLTASTISPATPSWLEALHATPMKLGLDLRGGVHFLLEVDIDSVIARREAAIVKSIGQNLREENIRYVGLGSRQGQGITLRFRSQDEQQRAYEVIHHTQPELELVKDSHENGFALNAKLSNAAVESIREYTLDQTMTTLRNRVNELGVAEAVVQQQGLNRVAVDLPGIQDANRAKQILGGTATLEFRMVDEKNDPQAAATGLVPVGSRLYEYNGGPLLLSQQVILSGDAIGSASSQFDQRSGLPAVGIHLGGGGESFFTRITRANIGHKMAIVYVETKTDSALVNGVVERQSHKVERVISVATIQDELGSNFQITGLSNADEARNLALMLRAGALPATIYPVEERIVGPTMGLENIKSGMQSLEIGMGIILVVMLVYYRLFGLFANVALIANLILLIAILSMIDATLTLPGIAGIVLTVGMAVDANVLIYERIREELRLGTTIQAAIHAGYERAFSTIVDANITTLIVAVVLFSIGSGPIKGFAVVLSIGLLTSMITGVAFTRALTNLVYGGRKVEKLSIGI